MLLRKGTERGFPKDWKLNRNMHPVAADNRDSGCESGLASLEIQPFSIFSMGKSDRKIICLTPRVEAEMPQMQLDPGPAASIVLWPDCGLSFRRLQLMETDQLRIHI